MPPTVPGLANCRKTETTSIRDNCVYTHVFFPMVCGGVSMEIDIRASTFSRDRTRELTAVRSAVLKARPGVNSLSWRLTES